MYLLEVTYKVGYVLINTLFVYQAWGCHNCIKRQPRLHTCDNLMRGDLGVVNLRTALAEPKTLLRPNVLLKY